MASAWPRRSGSGFCRVVSGGARTRARRQDPLRLLRKPLHQQVLSMLSAGIFGILLPEEPEEVFMQTRLFSVRSTAGSRPVGRAPQKYVLAIASKRWH